MTRVETLGTFVRAINVVPARTQNLATKAVFDLVIAAIVGHSSPGGRAARRAAEQIWGMGAAQVWFSDRRLVAAGSAFANAAAASMLDLDDGHRAASGHPGACVIPAVLATAEIVKADARQTLTAIALGYEVSVRIAAARDLSKVDTLVSGRWCGQGAAAAVAWLRDLSARQVAEAIAIAGVSAPNLTAVAYSRFMGNHVKEGIAWATATGMAAVDLAAAGFTGPLDLLDHDAHYDRARLTEGLGERWHMDDIYFKPYSCCRWAHAAIDGLLQIQATERISAQSIRSIKIDTFARALQLNNDLRPLTLEAAQYSIPFCLALAAWRGAEALLPLEEKALHDADVLALAERVSLSVDPKLDRMFPEAVPARIEIETISGRFVRTITAPKGEPSNPMDWSELKAKLSVATRDLVDPHFASQLLAAIDDLESGVISPLLHVLDGRLVVEASERVANRTAEDA
jgi:2-methylcitrate dehydratase PrpD